MQVWRQAADYDPKRGNPFAWLATIARTRSIDRLRASKRWSAALVPLDGDLRAPGQGPAESLAVRERQELVRKALDALKPEQREALEIAYFTGLTHVQIAQRLDLPLGTVKTRIRAGMIALRRYLDELELEP